MAKRWWPEATESPAGKGWAQPTEPTISNEGRTGSASFSSANVSNSDTIPQGERLCSANFREPTPSVVHIRVNATDGSLYTAIGHQSIDMVAEGTPAEVGLGVLIFEYGSGQAVQRVAADLKSGSYQLPPCEQVRIFAACYFLDEAIPAWTPDITVFGTIAPGTHIGCSRPTFTYAAQQMTTFDVDVPDNAREVDCYLIGDDLTTVLRLDPVNFRGLPTLVRDYGSGIWTPPYPATVNGCGQTYTLTSTVECAAAVQFTLEL